MAPNNLTERRCGEDRSDARPVHIQQPTKGGARHADRQGDDPVGMTGRSAQQAIHFRPCLGYGKASPLDFRRARAQRVIEPLVHTQGANFTHAGDPIGPDAERDG